MKNNKVLYSVIGIVALVILNAIIVTFVHNYSVATIIHIIGMNLAIIIFWVMGLMKGDKENHYLEYTKFPIVVTYSVVAFFVSGVLLLVKFSNVKISALIQIVMLGIFIIVMSTYKMANNATEASVTEDKKNYNKIKEMSDKLELIMNKIENREIYKMVEKAYDEVKSANISVQNDTTEIDTKIANEISLIENEINSNDTAQIEQNVKNIKDLIEERNKQA